MLRRGLGACAGGCLAQSYEEHTFAQKVLSPTRQGFGGHNEAKSHGSNRMEDKA
jgi:hypothetical protein